MVPTEPSGVQPEIHNHADIVYEEQSENEDDIIYEISFSSRLVARDGEDDIAVEDGYLEEIINDAPEFFDLDYDLGDDGSSIWIDDGRDHTKDANIAPLIFKDYINPGNLDGDEEDEAEDDFYLELSQTESVSSLEDHFDQVAHSSETSNALEKSMGRESNPQLSVSMPSEVRSVDQAFRNSDWGVEDTDLADRIQEDGQAEVMLQTEQVETLASMPPPITYFQHQRLQSKWPGNEKAIFCGRQYELETIRNALERIGDPGNAKRCIWISGESGIGKTALAEHFIHQFVRFRDQDSVDPIGENDAFLVGRGSFGERPLSHKPFSGLIDGLEELVMQIIQDCTREASWSERMREGLGKDAPLLVNLIPNMAQLLEVDRGTSDGLQGEKFDLKTSRLFHRTRFALRRFFRVICQHHKVVLFFDDLDWADDDSTKMIDTILSTHSLINFFFIGCHRGVKATHMLPRIKTRLSPLCAADISLQVLNNTESGDFMANFFNNRLPGDTLVNVAEGLSYLLNDITNRNPLHLHHLLSYFVECEKIAFDVETRKWDIVDTKVDRAALTSVQEVVSLRLKCLPIATTVAAKCAAFIGVKHFDLQLLYQAVQLYTSAARKKGSDPIAEDKAAFAEQVEVLKGKGFLSFSGPAKYRFSHDVIAKASSALMPIALAEQHWMHFEFATYHEATLATTSTDEKANLLAMVSDHFSFAVDRMKDTSKKHKLVKLKLHLARGAIRKAAFSAASLWLEAGLRLLNQTSPWKDSYVLSLKLHLEMARAQFCQGSYEASMTFVRGIILNANSPRDTIGAYELLICLAVATNNIEEAYRVTLQALKEIFNDMPKTDVEQEVASMRELLKSKTDADLTSLPEIVNKKVASKLLFLTRLAEISWTKHDFLSQDLAALKMMEATMQYGSSKSSSLAFVLYGICLARRNLPKEAFRFGLLGANTAADHTSLGSQAIAFHHYAIAYWKRPFQSSMIPLQQVVHVAVDSNDMENLSFRVGAFLALILATGSRLDIGDAVFMRFKEHSIGFHARETWFATMPFRLILKLRGEPIEAVERGFAKYTDARATQYGIFFQMIHAVIMQDMTTAEKLRSRIFHTPEGVWLPLRGFYEGLIATSLARDSSGKIRLQHQRKAARLIQVLSAWAKKGLRQAYHMVYLINCELRMLNEARMTTAESSSLYDSAIAAAGKAGFAHHEALANERAGAFFSLQQQDDLAKKYLTRACELYQTWGARAKVLSLKTKYPRHLDLPSITVVDASRYVVEKHGSSNLNSSLDFGESQIIHFNPINLALSRSERYGRDRDVIVGSNNSTGPFGSGNPTPPKEDGLGRSQSNALQLSTYSDDTEKGGVAAAADKEVLTIEVAKNEVTSERERTKNFDEDGAGDSPSCLTGTKSTVTAPSGVGLSHGGSWRDKEPSHELDFSHRSVSGVADGPRNEGAKALLHGFLKNLPWAPRRKKAKKEAERVTLDSDDRVDDTRRQYVSNKHPAAAIQESDEVGGGDLYRSHEDPVRPVNTMNGLGMGPLENLNKKVKASISENSHPYDDKATEEATEHPCSFKSFNEDHETPTGSLSRSRSQLTGTDPSARNEKEKPSRESQARPLQVGVDPDSASMACEPTRTNSKVKFEEQKTEEIGKQLKNVKHIRRSSDQTTGEDSPRIPGSRSSSLDPHQIPGADQSRPRNQTTEPTMMKHDPTLAGPPPSAPQRFKDADAKLTPLTGTRNSSETKIAKENSVEVAKLSKHIKVKHLSANHTSIDDSATKTHSLSSGLDNQQQPAVTQDRSRRRITYVSKRMKNNHRLTGPDASASQLEDDNDKLRIEDEMTTRVKKLKTSRHSINVASIKDSAQKPRSLSSGLDAHQKLVPSRRRSRSQSVDSHERDTNDPPMTGPDSLPPHLLDVVDPHSDQMSGKASKRKSKAKIEEESTPGAKRNKSKRRSNKVASIDESVQRPRSLSAGPYALQKAVTDKRRSRSQSRHSHERDTNDPPMAGPESSPPPLVDEVDPDLPPMAGKVSKRKSKANIEEKSMTGANKNKSKHRSNNGATTQDAVQRPRRPRSLSSGLDAHQKADTHKRRSRSHSLDSHERDTNDPPMAGPESSPPHLVNEVDPDLPPMAGKVSKRKSKANIEEKSVTGANKNKSKRRSNNGATTQDAVQRPRRPRSLSSGLDAHQQADTHKRRSRSQSRHSHERDTNDPPTTGPDSSPPHLVDEVDPDLPPMAGKVSKRKSKANIEEKSMTGANKNKSKRRSNNGATTQDAVQRRRRPRSLSSGLDAHQKADTHKRRSRSHSLDSHERDTNDPPMAGPESSPPHLVDEVYPDLPPMAGKVSKRKSKANIEEKSMARAKENKSKRRSSNVRRIEDSAQRPRRPRSLSSGLDAHQKVDTNKRRSRSHSLDSHERDTNDPPMAGPDSSPPYLLDEVDSASTLMTDKASKSKSKTKIEEKIVAGVKKNKSKRRSSNVASIEDAAQRPRSHSLVLEPSQEPSVSPSRALCQSADQSTRTKKNSSMASTPTSAQHEEGIENQSDPMIGNNSTRRKSRAKIDGEAIDGAKTTMQHRRPVHFTNTEDQTQKPHSLSSGPDDHKILAASSSSTERFRSDSAEPSERDKKDILLTDRVASTSPRQEGVDNQSSPKLDTPTRRKLKVRIKKETTYQVQRPLPKRRSINAVSVGDSGHSPRRLSPGMEQKPDISPRTSRTYSADPSMTWKNDPPLTGPDLSPSHINGKIDSEQPPTRPTRKKSFDEIDVESAIDIAPLQSTDRSATKTNIENSAPAPRRPSSGLDAHQAPDTSVKEKKVPKPTGPDASASRPQQRVDVKATPVAFKPFRRKSLGVIEEGKAYGHGDKAKKNRSKHKSSQIESDAI